MYLKVKKLLTETINDQDFIKHRNIMDVLKTK